MILIQTQWDWEKNSTLHSSILGRFCECEEDKEVTCVPDCENGGTCECGQCKCKEGFVGKCCQFKDCDQGKCLDEEKTFCGGIGDAACSGKDNAIVEWELKALYNWWTISILWNFKLDELA